MYARWLRGRRCRTDNWSWWRRGGVAIGFRRHLKCSLLSLPLCHALEAVAARLVTANGPVVIVNIYRLGSERLSTAFFGELTGLLELLVPYSGPVVVGGDLNVHVNDADSTYARQLTSLLSSFDMVQHVYAALPTALF